ncbi:uncharacterized protein LOC131855779 [Cryptomeria japonica]|uniref:uncharacterized protein LOC131855779 n=1 Tax=Cryptomeria japonica TaxID=3369 RepID=UPI0027DA1474|nr:uncharacterized protein LOC131855779 [Cryptomeria japonica]
MFWEIDRDVLLFHSYSFTLNNPTRKQNLKKDHSGEDFTAECLTKLQLQISLVCQSTNQSAGIVELTYTSDIQHTRNTYRDLCSYINRYGASSDYLVNCGKRDSLICKTMQMERFDSTLPSAPPANMEVLYAGRHKHRLYLSEGLIRYRCNGCKAYGANTGYKCHLCGNVTFHISCID